MNKRPETTKLLEENIGIKVHGTEFLDLTPKVKSTSAKINEWDHIKLKSFCTVEVLSTKGKGNLLNRKKIHANHVSDKGLISKIYKELIQFNSKNKKPKIFIKIA